MTIDPKIRSEALGIIRERKAQRLAELSRRREEIYRTVPRIREIDARLRRDSAEAALTALRHGSSVSAAIETLKNDSLDLQAERCELLVANGYPASYLDDESVCPLCGDTGYVGATPCKCFTELAKKCQVRELSHVLDMESVSFDSFDFSYYSDSVDPHWGASPRENAYLAYDYCLEYARKFDTMEGSLFLNGGTGLGKTFLSTCIAREVANAGFSVVYETAVDMLSHFEAAQFNREEDESETKRAVNRVLNCDLLIIDDLGTELTTAFTQSALYTVINTRLLNGRKTVINSNLTMEDVRRRYSQQILSRLEGEFNTVFLFGQDIRLQKKQRKK